jgi:hypothetical protein
MLSNDKVRTQFIYLNWSNSFDKILKNPTINLASYV